MQRCIIETCSTPEPCAVHKKCLLNNSKPMKTSVFIHDVVCSFDNILGPEKYRRITGDSFKKHKKKI